MPRTRLLPTLALTVLLAGCGEMGETDTGKKSGPGDGPVGEAGPSQDPAGTTGAVTETPPVGAPGTAGPMANDSMTVHTLPDTTRP